MDIIQWAFPDSLLHSSLMAKTSNMNLLAQTTTPVFIAQKFTTQQMDELFSWLLGKEYISMIV